MSTKEKFEGWAVLELMGHRRLAGYVQEAEIAGGAFVRIDVPEVVLDASDDTAATQFYSPGAVYCITPCTEEAARAVAGRIVTTAPALLGLPAPRVVYEHVDRCRTCEHEANVHLAEDDGGPGPCRVEGCLCMKADFPDPDDLPF